MFGTLGLLGMVACGTGGAGSQSAFPPRPADLSVPADRPCGALAPAQLAQLELVDARPTERSGLPECIFRTSDYRVWSVLVTPGVSAQTYLPEDPNYQGDQLGYVAPRATAVSGFGAVEFVNSITASNSDCVLAIDASPDVTLLVSYLDTSSRATGDRSVGSRAEGCAQASRVASMVIETARARVTG